MNSAERQKSGGWSNERSGSNIKIASIGTPAGPVAATQPISGGNGTSSATE